jgi:hypothetical protein
MGSVLPVGDSVSLLADLPPASSDRFLQNPRGSVSAAHGPYHHTRIGYMALSPRGWFGAVPINRGLTGTFVPPASLSCETETPLRASKIETLTLRFVALLGEVHNAWFIEPSAH